MKENTTSRYEQTGKTKNMAVIGLMTAVICIIAPFSIPIPVSPVPISLTNFIIFMAVYILGMKSASICVILYLLLGGARTSGFFFFQRWAGKTCRTDRRLPGRIYPACFYTWILS